MNFQPSPYLQYYQNNVTPAPGSPGYIRPGSPEAQAALKGLFSIGK
jgi:hypothetical protein